MKDSFLRRKRNYNLPYLIAAVICSLTITTSTLADYPQNVTSPSAGLAISRNAADFNLNALTTLGGYDKAVFFIDPGWTYTESWKHGGTSKELNAGTGIRLYTPNIFEDGAVVGANLYYDKKWTVNDNTYNQFGLGFELLSDYIDARINGFVPGANKKRISGSGKQTYFSQTAVHSMSNSSNEYAFTGYTSELGIRLPFEKDLGIFRIYGGYDDFRASGISNASTWKVKATYSPTRYVQFAFNYYSDKSPYNSHWLLGVNASIPLDWAGFRIVDRQDRSAPVSRMHERVVRW